MTNIYINGIKTQVIFEKVALKTVVVRFNQKWFMRKQLLTTGL